MIDELYDEINKFEMIYNKKPKVIYLGHSTYHNIVIDYTLHVAGLPSTNDRVTFYGLPVYIVNADEYMEIG